MLTKDASTRKTDRRTLYTRKIIKDALLELLETQHYEKISIAALCRQAEITRTTFYIHFQNMDEVLNELLNEALMPVETIIEESDSAARMRDLEKLMKTGSADDLRRNEHLLSPCQRVADDPKYRAIFQDPTLAGYVIRWIYRKEREQMLVYLTDRCRIEQGQADKLLMMIIFGLFYLNQALKWNKDDAWYEMQFLATQFLCGGLEAVRKRKQNRTGNLSDPQSEKIS